MQHVRRFSGRSATCGPRPFLYSGSGRLGSGALDPLERRLLRDSINQRLNLTLLHEFGHVVDYLYHAMDGLRRRDPSLYRLLGHDAPYRRTGAQRGLRRLLHMIFVVTQLARSPYHHPADPAAYQGDQATRHFEALLNSPAFDDWVGARSELRRSASGSA